MGGSELADWIAAIGQAVGALGTFAAVVVALFVARRDRLDREASQARLVTTRVAGDWEQIVDGATLAMVVVNNSDSPIFNLQIFGVRAIRKDGSVSEWIADGQSLRDIEEIHPHTAATFTGLWRVEATSPEIIAVRSRIQFTDSAGTWWQRVNNGAVVRRRERRSRAKWEEFDTAVLPGENRRQVGAIGAGDASPPMPEDGVERRDAHPAHPAQSDAGLPGPGSY